MSSLSLLLEIFPSKSKLEITKALSNSNGSVERATECLLGSVESENSTKRLKIGLDSWLGVKQPKESKLKKPTVIKGNSKEGKETKLNAFDLLKPPIEVVSAPVAKMIEICTAEAVYDATNGLCTLIENILPKELAATLFLSSVENSTKWEKNRWYLFDRLVSSPHTTSFFVERPSDDPNASYDQAGIEEASKYWYNGEKREAFYFNEEMNTARSIVGERVRKEMSTRTKHPLEWDGEWQPNVSAANCYRGQNESVGWHTDVLSYLGPYPTIASLSLGVKRQFRLKLSNSTKNDTMSIELPHNCLLIMHGGIQELYKHTVPPAKSIDLFKIPPSLGFSEVLQKRRWNERINYTFRFYRPDFAPLASTSDSISSNRSSNFTGTPICRCGVPCSLRPDSRGKVKARMEENRDVGEGSGNDELLFFWVCNAGGQAEGKTCSHFQLLDFKKEGRGVYFKK